ncbi:hypothetical protein VNO78_20231 [Psophocarpus tetragonolobus]|uniref:Uncharacterized protein n=1 Tax=Psophocarpus tetragonolobus TaxID=3891 RepID=A0AAN9XGX5_PSOTE
MLMQKSSLKLLLRLDMLTSFSFVLLIISLIPALPSNVATPSRAVSSSRFLLIAYYITFNCLSHSSHSGKPFFQLLNFI